MKRVLKVLGVIVVIGLVAVIWIGSRPDINRALTATAPQELPTNPVSEDVAAALTAEAGRDGSPLDAVVIMDGESVAYRWGDAATPMDIASVRKGMVSLLFGIASDKGLVDFDATLADLGIDESATPLTEEEKQATILDLIASRSGIYIASGAETDWMKENRPARGSAAPGEQFFYNNWDFNVVGVIFEAETGQTIGAAFNDWIALPLGMQDFHPDHVVYDPPEGSTDFRRYKMYLSARDLARVGVMVQQDGQWGGEQIVSPDWVALIKTPVSVLDPGDPESGAFSYSWWIDGRDGNLYHEGWGGQYLYLDDAKNLVVVTRTDNGNRFYEQAVFFLFGTQGELDHVDALRALLPG